MKKFFVFLVHFASSFLKMGQFSTCRFHPSCGAYASEAFEKKPFLTAVRLCAKRLLRCRPGHPGGYDPLTP